MALARVKSLRVSIERLKKASICIDKDCDLVLNGSKLNGRQYRCECHVACPFI